MLNSKTLNDLVATYQAAKKQGDSTAINHAEAALTSFSHAESAMVTMRVSEAVSAAASGFRIGDKA